jgi:hypothetical protein
LKINIGAMKYFKFFGIIFLLLVFVPIACEKGKGFQDVDVIVKLTDQNWYKLNDHSGVTVALTRGNETFKGITNEYGKTIFPKLPYGSFNVTLEKEGFIPDLIGPFVINNTSDSVWSYFFQMVEIPTFRITIDSIFYKSRMDDRAFAYGNITDLKGMPAVQYGLRVFFSITPDVSKDNYLFYHFGTIMGRLIKDGRYEMWINNWSGGVLEGDYDTLYVRVYPCAFYSEWTKLRKEGLGTPAEVYKWVLPENLK